MMQECSNDKIIAERHQAREITQEILNYGVSEDQKFTLIRLLAEQLENYTLMQLLTWFIDKLETTELSTLSDQKIAELRSAACTRMNIVMSGNQ